MKKQIDICIKNKTFWPENKTLSEGFSCLGECFVSQGFSSAINW